MQKAFLKNISSHFWVTQIRGIGPLREALILSDTSISSSLSLAKDILRVFGLLKMLCDEILSFIEYWRRTGDGQPQKERLA